MLSLSALRRHHASAASQEVRILEAGNPSQEIRILEAGNSQACNYVQWEESVESKSNITFRDAIGGA